MKILFISDNFPPEINAAATRYSRKVQAAAGHGRKVGLRPNQDDGAEGPENDRD